MLHPMQAMEYYLRTGFGESASHFGGKDDPKQGGCQDNGGAPPTWLQISTLLINTQKRLNHGITSKSPILQNTLNQIGILYVDDTNLWVGLDEDDNLELDIFKGQ